ncbi:MAG: hypothetical protein HKN20_14655 [Gemmatimonadetes bacterium]|nr:hypothetical protein [Gemmatimonadota bacterium]
MSIGGVGGGNFNPADLTKFDPPKQSKFSKFTSILGGAASAIPGVGSALGAIGAVAGGGAAGASTSFNRQYELLQLQNQIQQEAQTINMISNINKAKHEASMAAIRNVK